MPSSSSNRILLKHDTTQPALKKQGSPHNRHSHATPQSQSALLSLVVFGYSGLDGPTKSFNQDLHIILRKTVLNLRITPFMRVMALQWSAIPLSTTSLHHVHPTSTFILRHTALSAQVARIIGNDDQKFQHCENNLT